MKSVRLEETWNAEHCSGNTAVSTKVATVPGSNEHKQNTKTSSEVRVS
jgi:hypothetical protein